MTLPEPDADHGRREPPGKAFCLGLLRRSECLAPTLRGCAVLLACAGICVLTLAFGLQPFLAPNDPQPGGALVVEGWAGDFTLAAAADEFRRNHYEKLYVTGGPILDGGVFAEYKTTAEFGAAILFKMGLTTNEVQPVPAAEVARDRTYNSALCLKRWMLRTRAFPAKLNLMTEGPHARRSRLLYEKAFGSGVKVGVVAVPSQNYDPSRWWKSCQGTRTVLGEAIAYCYARFLFHSGSQ